jgi:hypothetical protein
MSERNPTSCAERRFAADSNWREDVARNTDAYLEFCKAGLPAPGQGAAISIDVVVDMHDGQSLLQPSSVLVVYKVFKVLRTIASCHILVTALSAHYYDMGTWHLPR